MLRGKGIAFIELCIYKKKKKALDFVFLNWILSKTYNTNISLKLKNQLQSSFYFYNWNFCLL